MILIYQIFYFLFFIYSFGAKEELNINVSTHKCGIIADVTVCGGNQIDEIKRYKINFSISGKMLNDEIRCHEILHL